MNYFTLFGILLRDNRKKCKTDIGKAVSKRNNFLFILFFTFNFCYAQVYSQLSSSDTIAIHSKVFGTERKIIVTSPSKIKNGDPPRNGIVYLDADNQNINGILLQSANNLMTNQEIPQSYLVGIIHENRNAELLEKDQLLNFLKEELIPLLRDRFGIAEPFTIVGHSFGGYFATYAFLKDNDIYNSCIAISPAYWPNKNDVLNLLQEKQSVIRGNFYLAVGDKRWDEISLRKGIFKAQNILVKQSGIVFNFSDLKGFSHNATPIVGLGLGLNFIYDGWEWTNILEEQDNKLKLFPGFWGHLEIKADALFHLNSISKAKSYYLEALVNVAKDENLSTSEMSTLTKRLRAKLKKCR